MLYKNRYDKTVVIMCHDGNFIRIHELMDSLKLLEIDEEERDGCEKVLYWSNKAAIEMIKKEIWRLFLDIESQRAEYSNDEWHQMYESHRKQRDEHPGPTYPENIKEIG